MIEKATPSFSSSTVNMARHSPDRGEMALTILPDCTSASLSGPVKRRIGKRYFHSQSTLPSRSTHNNRLASGEVKIKRFSCKIGAENFRNVIEVPFDVEAVVSQPATMRKPTEWIEVQRIPTAQRKAFAGAGSRALFGGIISKTSTSGWCVWRASIRNGCTHCLTCRVL